jgi:p-aminobenzoyl-glutamate transporter AbgT
MGLLQLIRGLDSGSSVGLNFRGQETVTSVCGGLMTMGVYTLILLYLCAKVLVLFNKEDINVVQYLAMETEEMKQVNMELSAAETGFDVMVGFISTRGFSFVEVPENIGKFKFELI